MAIETTAGLSASQDATTTIPALIVANFFEGVTPSLERLADLSAFAQLQFDYYSLMGVGQPLLGPYEALGRGFGETEGFRAKYGALTDDFVATAYAEVFGRAPNAAQVQHFNAQVEYFVSIYVPAGIPAETASLLAKGAAIGQMLGEAALHGSAAFDYSGAAMLFIDRMDDAGFVPGQPLSNFDPNPPVEPEPIGATLTDHVLTLSAADTYKLTVNASGDLVVTRAGTSIATVIPAGEIDALTGVVIESASGTAEVKGSDIASLQVLSISGAGKFNVTNVALDTPPFVDAPNLSKLTFDSADPTGVLPANLLVNGSFTDAFVAMWAGINYGYYPALPAGSAVRDMVLVGLSNDYVQYLKDHDPIDLVVQVDGAGQPRAQTLHDSLLGYINDAVVSARVAQPDNYDDVRTAESLTYGPRPHAEGYTNDPSDERAALAWDFTKGLKHDAYESHAASASVDSAGLHSSGNLWFAFDAGTGLVSGNAPTGFNLGRHEGAGIELGLKASLHDGADIAPASTAADGTTHYTVPAGGLAGGGGFTAAQWDLDFSALTGLNGRSAENLSSYAFVLRIDTDPSAGVVYRDFLLEGDASTGVFNWVDSTGAPAAVVADADGVNPSLSQNSVNFGVEFLRDMIDTSPAPGVQPYALAAGQFDVELTASQGGVQLVGTHIVIDVV